MATAASFRFDTLDIGRSAGIVVAVVVVVVLVEPVAVVVVVVFVFVLTTNKQHFSWAPLQEANI